METGDTQLYLPDERPDYLALAVLAEQRAHHAEARHVTAVWQEVATTYRELAEYHGAASYSTPRAAS
jgi:hypothetical protein